MRGIEIRAVTAVAGLAAATAAAAFRWAACEGSGEAVAVGDAEGEGDGLVDTVARACPAVAASLAGERVITAAAIASKRTTQTADRIRRPRLMPP